MPGKVSWNMTCANYGAEELKCNCDCGWVGRDPAPECYMNEAAARLFGQARQGKGAEKGE